MKFHRMFAVLGLTAAVTLPGLAGAQMASAPMMKPPTQAQVKTALMSTNPTMRQMRTIKPMVESYKSSTAGADDATKQAAAKTLMGNVMKVLTPAQQTEFKQSLMSQMAAG